MLDDKSIQDFKDIYEKEYGQKFTWQEASEASHNLVGFFDLLLQIDRRDKLRKLELKKYPKGFHITDGIYTCLICHRQISGDETWYDKYGIKCMLCQKALEHRLMPAKAFRDKDSWYSLYDLAYWYGIRTAAARKLVREGKLKARIVPGADGKPHFYVFMIKDNPKLKTPKPHTKIARIGDNRYTSKEPEKMKLVL